GQRAALDVLHREVGQAAVLAKVVDAHDVRVVEPGDRLGLAAEAGQLLGGRLPAAPDRLEGNDAVETDLAGPVDDAHAARLETGQHDVPGEVERLLGPGRGCQRAVLPRRRVEVEFRRPGQRYRSPAGGAQDVTPPGALHRAAGVLPAVPAHAGEDDGHGAVFPR